MAYRLDITARAIRNLQRIYTDINAADSEQARNWFKGLDVAIRSLDQNPYRGPVTPGDRGSRHLHYGKNHVYLITYRIDDLRRVVTVIHIRHGARLPPEQA